MSEAPVRPRAAAGQVWRVAFSKGSPFIRVDEVRLRKSEDAYVNRVRVTDATGGVVYRDPGQPFAHYITTTKLEGGQMPACWTYVGEAAPDHEPGVNPTPARRKEEPVSTNPTETVPTPETKPTPKKKVAGIPSAKKAAAPKKTKAAPKAKAEPKPKAEKKAKPETTNRMSDEDVAKFVNALLKKDPETTRAAALKALRATGASCSQERFAPTFVKCAKAAK